MKPLQTITAINRLTHERESVSAKSTSVETLQAMLHTFLQTPSRKRTHIYPRIQVVQQNIF